MNKAIWLAAALTLSAVPAEAGEFYSQPYTNARYHPIPGGSLGCYDARGHLMLAIGDKVGWHKSWQDLQRWAEARQPGYFKILLRQAGCSVVGQDTTWLLLGSDGNLAKMAEHDPNAEPGDTLRSMYFLPADLHGQDGKPVPNAIEKVFRDGRQIYGPP